MKKKSFIPYILVLLIMVLAFTGCVSDNEGKSSDKGPVENPVDPKDNEDSASQIDKKTIEEFRTIEKDSPTPDILIKYIDGNIEKVSTSVSDEMIDTLEILLEKNKTIYEDRIFELDRENELIEIDGMERDFRVSSIDKIKDEKLKIEVTYLYSNMYKLTNVEGSFYPIIDYDKLKVYDKYISGEWKDYIAVRSL